MQDKERETVRVRVRCVLALAALFAILGVAGVSAQSEASANTWTFSVDSSNNLVVQDLEAFNAAQVTGMRLCLRYYPSCPPASDRRSADMKLARPRYTLRGGTGGDWRIEPGQPTLRDTGAVLPFQVGGVEQGMVQIVSSPGAWAVDLQRIPASELRVGDGKRWNVFLTLSGASADGVESCWIEVGCGAP
ncbi:MAG TPA: hypothetical protein VH394_28055 [Thermoanaerobaculia bacterium]|jgi:hypothetical protein|nr:hypothetical protein [Thermoanaerobaculia bacterium]